MAAQREWPPPATRDLQDDKVVVTLTSLSGAKLDLGAFPRNSTVRQVRDVAGELLGVRVAHWTFLYEADILGDNGMTLAQVDRLSTHSIKLTVVRNAAPRFISCTPNARLMYDGLAFQGPWDEDRFDSWALVQPSVSSLTVRLGSFSDALSGYFLGVVPLTCMETWTPGSVPGVCLFMQTSGCVTVSSDECRARLRFARSTFAEGDFVAAEFDRQAGVCRFGRGDPGAGFEWSDCFSVDFEGQLAVGVPPHGHVVICA